MHFYVSKNIQPCLVHPWRLELLFSSCPSTHACRFCDTTICFQLQQTIFLVDLILTQSLPLCIQHYQYHLCLTIVLFLDYLDQYLYYRTEQTFLDHLILIQYKNCNLFPIFLDHETFYRYRNHQI